MLYNILLGIYLCSQAALAQPLSEADYVAKVIAENSKIKSADDRVKSAIESEKTIDIQTSTQMLASVNRFDKRWPSETPTPSFSRSSGYVSSVALQKQTSFGLSGKIQVDIAKTRLHDFSMGGASAPSDRQEYALTPSVELSQSLWKNSFGRLISLQSELLKFQSSAARAQGELQKQMLAVEAGVAYQRLAYSQANLNISKDAVGVAEKIYALVKSKYQMNLNEKSDFLQAQTLWQSRKVERTMAESELATAAIGFNSLLGVNSAEVEGTIAGLDDSDLENAKEHKFGDHPEIKFIDTQLDLAEKGISLAEESQKPDLALFGQYTLQSKNENMSKTFSEVDDPYQPYSVIGLKLQMVLDRSLVQSQVTAKRLEASALRHERNSRKESLDQMFQTLVSRRKNAVEVFKTIKELAESQKNKLDNEQAQFRNGRSTTYQLLMFTQDLADAQKRKLQTAYEIVMLDRELALFAGAGL